ncbi:hypothetical protein [Xenorhabdus stockiae]|uniref:hypothetical protein n=1 Tax=Xenorhabdus stockiae TaxID=351614 RepID=UPI004064AA25
MKNNKESLYLRELAYLQELAQHVAKYSPDLANFLISAHDLLDNPVPPVPLNTYFGLQPLVEYYALPPLYNCGLVR